MNSCIYIAKLRHERLKPRRNAFQYNIYLMYLDMDELDELGEKLWFFSLNKWNIFSFFDQDHFKFIDYELPAKQTISREKVKYDRRKYAGKNTRERIEIMIGELGLGFKLSKVYIMTNLRHFGYIFNPVSFYFCFDEAGKLRAMFSEVNNTFHDQKMFYIAIDDPEQKTFTARQRKNFYISPFTGLDNVLHWDFEIPGETMRMDIDSVKDGQVELTARISGRMIKLSNPSLLFLVFRYPLYTLMVMIRIHWQALKLWFKKVPFNAKDASDDKILKNIGQKL